MKLHLPFGLRKAVMACLTASAFLLPVTTGSGVVALGGAAVVSLLSSQQVMAASWLTTEHTTVTVDDIDEDIIFSGRIYTITGTSEWAFNTTGIYFTQYAPEDGGLMPDGGYTSVHGQNQTASQELGTGYFYGILVNDPNGTRAYGHTLRLDETSPDVVKYQFNYLALGGIWAEGKAHTVTSYTLQSNPREIQLVAAEGLNVEFIIKSDLLFTHDENSNNNNVVVKSHTNMRVANGATLTWDRSLNTTGGSNINISNISGTGTGKVVVTGSLTVAGESILTVGKGAELELQGNLSTDQAIHNDGSIVFGENATLTLSSYTTRTLTDTHLSYTYDLFEGSGSISGLETLTIIGGNDDYHWNDAQTGIIYDAPFKVVTEAEFVWRDRSPISDTEVFTNGDTLKFVTQTTATLGESVTATAIYVAEGAALTLLKTVNSYNLATTREILLDGDLILTKANLLSSNTTITDLSDTGRVVMDIGKDNSLNTQQLLSSGTTYTGTLVIRSGRLEDSGQAYSRVIVEAGGQFSVSIPTISSEFEIAGDGFSGTSGANYNDGGGALRLGANTHVMGDITLASDGAGIMVWQGATAYVDSTIHANGNSFSKYAAGTLIVTGKVEGTDTFHVLSGTLQLQQDWVGNLNMTGPGTLTMQGEVSGADTLYVEEGTLKLANILRGSGALTKTGAGTLMLAADSAYSGTLNIKEGTVRVGESDTANNTLAFQQINIYEGGTLSMNHAVADFGDIGVTVYDGGTMHMNDSDSASTPIIMGTLTIDAEEQGATVSMQYNGGLRFSQLTGSGDILIKKLHTGDANGTNEPSSLVIDEIRDYSGTITMSWAQQDETKRLNHTNVISAVHQSEGFSATLEVKVKSEGFRKTGEGALTLAAGMEASRDLWMRCEGELNITGPLTIAKRTVLHYEGETSPLLQITDAEGVRSWIGRDQITSAVFIYAYDFTEAELKQGVNLGISGDVDPTLFPILGFEDGAYEIYERDGAWHLRAESGATVDPSSTDDLWDANWGNELRTRPVGQINVVSGETATVRDSSNWGNRYSFQLSGDDDKYAARAGTAIFAQIEHGSVSAPGSPVDIFGGRRYTNGGGAECSQDVWLSVVSGEYGAIVGGLDTDVWMGNHDDYAHSGNTHIILQAKAGSKSTPTVDRILGGNYGSGVSSSFYGDSYISVVDGNVREWIVGGSYGAVTGNSNHRRDVYFTGDSNIYVYTVLEKGEAQLPVSGAAYAKHLVTCGTNFIAGGNFLTLAQTSGDYTSVYFTGDSHITLDLTGKRGVFGKALIGGDVLITNFMGNVIHTGDASIRIVGANNVTFTEQIIGGSFNDGNAVAHFIGDTYLDIEGGIFRNVIIAGSAQGVQGEATGGADYVININPDLSHTGDTHLLIRNGEFYGYETILGAERNVPAHSIGSVAIVGGNHMDESSNTSSNRLSTNKFNGTSHIVIEGGRFHGHIVGGTVLEGITETNNLPYFHTELTTDGTEITMTGGEMVKAGDISSEANIDWAPRIVGGILIHDTSAPRTAGYDLHSVTLGDAKVTIAGSATVYDVVGGSWTPCFDAVHIDPDTTWQGLRVRQGNISVTLGGNAVVKGDVYAAGIQGGKAGIETNSTSVSIGSGVDFYKWDGSSTIVSGGYLTESKVDLGAEDEIVWAEQQDAYGAFYTEENEAEHSTVSGTRSLIFTDAEDYGANLERVRLLNFDEVTLQAGTRVQAEALIITDAGAGAEGNDTITIQGGGELAMKGTYIEVPDYSGEEAGTKQILNNSSMLITEGSSLFIMNSGATGANAITTLDKIVVESGTLTLDLAHDRAHGNDLVRVNQMIEIAEGNKLIINLRVSDELASGLDTVLISALNPHVLEQPGEDEVEGGVAAASELQATETPTLSIKGTKVQINFTAIDLPADGGKKLHFTLADNVLRDGDTEFNTSCNGSLYKWFGNSVMVRVVDDPNTGREMIVFDGTVITPDTADFHRRNAQTANGRAGAKLLDAMYATLNPELNAPGSDRAALLSGLEKTLGEGNFAEADRTMAAAAGASLATLGLALADDVERQLRAIRNRTTTIAGNYDPDNGGLDLSFWLNAETDYRKLDTESTMPGYKLNSWGGTVGMSSDVTPHTSIGVALTAMYGDFEADGPDKTKGDMNTSYLSAFARTSQGAWSHTFIASVGMASVDVKRTVSHSAGSYSTQAETDGLLLGFMYEVGYSYLLNEQGSSCLQPVLNVSWKHIQLDGYTEKGSDAALRVDDTKSDTLVLGGGLRLQSLVGSNTINRNAILEARVLAKGYIGGDADKATVGFMGMPQKADVKARETGNFGVEFGAGFTLPTTSRGTNALFLDASLELRDAYTNFNATLGWKANF